MIEIESMNDSCPPAARPNIFFKQLYRYREKTWFTVILRKQELCNNWFGEILKEVVQPGTRQLSFT